MAEPTQQEQLILTALVALGRPRILEHFEAASCIASTRIGIDVLAYFGITAEALPVRTVIWNAEAAQLRAQGVDESELQARMEAIPVETTGGPWVVGLGFGDGWEPGHLVVTVPRRGVLLDLSLDQAARPQKGLDLSATWVQVPHRAWWEGTERATNFRTDSEVVLQYQAFPELTEYRRMNNWRGTSATRGGSRVFREVTGQIIREIRIVSLEAGEHR